MALNIVPQIEPPKIECVPLFDLVPYALNARTHSDAQVGELRRAIERWGFTTPILYDAEGIIAGHGRVLAVSQIYKAGRRIRFSNRAPIPPETIPAINVSGWTPEERRAAILADNELAAHAGWDLDILAGETKALHDMGFDLSLAGFDNGVLDELWARLEDDEEEAPGTRMRRRLRMIRSILRPGMSGCSGIIG